MKKTCRLKWEFLLAFLLLMLFVGPPGVLAAEEETTIATPIGVSYRGHVENYGNIPDPEGTLIAGPEAIGTRGQGLRVEGFWIELTGDVPEDAGISYQVHVQNMGWMDPVENGQFVGTEGQGLRIESIRISLENLDDYDVYYRGHVQNVGNIPQLDGEWGWVKNGEELGTTGDGLRLEELEIKIVRRDTDLTAFNEVMDNVNNLSADDYTSESWTALQAVISDYGITEASLQEDVDLAVTAIEEALQALDLKVMAIYDTPGTYGPEEGSETIEGSVVISVSGVTLQNLIIKGDLTIAESVGDGNATLNNLTVYGNTNIYGGGADSNVATEGILTMASSGGITINGGNYKSIMIGKDKNTGKILIALYGETEFTTLEIEAGDNIILDGQFKNVSICTPDLNIEVTEGSSVENLYAGFSVWGSKLGASRLHVTGQGTIKNVYIPYYSHDVVIDLGVTGTAQVDGDNAVFNGSVNNAVINGNNTTFENEPDSYEVGEDGSEPVITNPKTDPTTGGGGGGGYTPPVASVTATPTAAMSELNLDSVSVTLTLSNQTFADATLDKNNFTLNNAPSGLIVESVAYSDSSQMALAFSFDGTDFDTDITNFSITIAAAELSSSSDLTTNNMTITAVVETLAGNLTVSSAAEGSTLGTTVLSIDETAGTGNSLVYKVGGQVSGVAVNDTVTDGSAFISGSSQIAVTVGQYVTIYEINGSNQVVNYVSRQIDSSEIKVGLTATPQVALSESNLDGAVINLTLFNETFAGSTLLTVDITLNNAPSGVTVSAASVSDSTHGQVTLAYDGMDFDTSVNNFSITIAAAQLTGSSDLTTGNMAITAVVESSDAGLTSVVTLNDSSPTGSGTSGDPILWSISVPNSTATLGLSDISVAANAGINLYSNADFTNGEITGTNTMPLTSGGDTDAYIKVTAQDGTTIKYYAVTISRAAAAAGTLTISMAVPGTTAGTTIVYIDETASTVNSLVYKVTAIAVSGLTEVDQVTGGAAFVSGSTQIDVSTNRYVTVYEIDGSGYVVRYACGYIQDAQINNSASASGLTVTASAADTPASGAIKVTVTGGTGSSLFYRVVSDLPTAPDVGDTLDEYGGWTELILNPETISGVTNNSYIEVVEATDHGTYYSITKWGKSGQTDDGTTPP